MFSSFNNAIISHLFSFSHEIIGELFLVVCRCLATVDWWGFLICWPRSWADYSSNDFDQSHLTWAIKWANHNAERIHPASTKRGKTRASSDRIVVYDWLRMWHEFNFVSQLLNWVMRMLSINWHYIGNRSNLAIIKLSVQIMTELGKQVWRHKRRLWSLTNLRPKTILMDHGQS